MFGLSALSGLFGGGAAAAGASGGGLMALLAQHYPQLMMPQQPAMVPAPMPTAAPMVMPAQPTAMPGMMSNFTFNPALRSPNTGVAGPNPSARGPLAGMIQQLRSTGAIQ